MCRYSETVSSSAISDAASDAASDAVKSATAVMRPVLSVKALRGDAPTQAGVSSLGNAGLPSAEASLLPSGRRNLVGQRGVQIRCHLQIARGGQHSGIWLRHMGRRDVALPREPVAERVAAR